MHYHSPILVGSVTVSFAGTANDAVRFHNFICACGQLVERRTDVVSRHADGRPLQERITYKNWN